jgi:photosystem II stability/assembly factor-like uncharacterized protein
VAGDPGGVSGALYATHDGGATWHRVTSVPEAATVEAASGRVWLVTGPHPGDAHSLYWAATGSDTFTKVADRTGTGLVLHGHDVYAYGAGNDLLSIRDGTVSRRELPCADGYQAGAVLAAAGDLSLAVICTGPPTGPGTPTGTGAGSGTGAGTGTDSAKQGFSSTDGGVTWAPMKGAPDPAGFATSLAATPAAVFVAGRGMPVRVSRDAGATWAVALRPPTPDGFSYVGFTDADHGVALGATPSAVIYLTADAGRTWKPHEFG